MCEPIRFLQLLSFDAIHTNKHKTKESKCASSLFTSYTYWEMCQKYFFCCCMNKEPTFPHNSPRNNCHSMCASVDSNTMTILSWWHDTQTAMRRNIAERFLYLSWLLFNELTASIIQFNVKTGKYDINVKYVVEGEKLFLASYVNI